MIPARTPRCLHPVLAGLMLAALSLCTASSVAAPDADAAAQQKLGLLEYYLNGDAALAIDRSDSALARELLEQARARALGGRTALAEGNAGEASHAFTEALRAFSAAQDAARRDPDADPQLPRRNAALLAEITAYLATFDAGLRDRGPAAAALLDRTRIDALLTEAEARTAQGRHGLAARALGEAYPLVVQALSALRAGDTVTHALNFSSPIDEYRYELERFQELQQMAREAVAGGAAQGQNAVLVSRFMGRADALYLRSREQAAAGGFEAAIRLVELARRESRRALNAMGLAVP